MRVADGEPLGDADCVRAAIRDRHAADRLLWALREALHGPAPWKHPRDEGDSQRRPRCSRWRCWAAAGRDKKPTGPQKLDLEIGNLLPLTGFLDPFGKPSERAANVAAEEIRKAAAKAGARHTVQIHNVDYKSEPNDGGRAREQARRRTERPA